MPFGYPAGMTDFWVNYSNLRIMKNVGGVAAKDSLVFRLAAFIAGRFGYLHGVSHGIHQGFGAGGFAQNSGVWRQHGFLVVRDGAGG